jgi:small-conductance mechanosensitive channel
VDRIGRPFAIIAFHRGLRIVLIAGGALAVAHILDLDLTALAATDTAAMRAARAVLDVVIIVLVADFIWQMTRVWIDHRLSETVSGDNVGTEAETRNRQRVRTLLPILRHVMFFAVIAVAGITALSTIGVAVGPLVAGAGVFGIAIGFGAQTLVKDIISGMFFLFDDAFRVGEYIESGHIKGTVEAFSLRSIKLRHHRGALHTVPFGALSTITNYSRDWVIDKMSIGVTYDTDLEAVKRIVKEIGRALQNDPEFAPKILETLKMQGIEELGDFAIRLRLKMTTRPGEQSAIRRRAYALINRAFDEHGIRFAYPTVAVASDALIGATAASAAAKVGLELVPPRSTAASGLGDAPSS